MSVRRVALWIRVLRGEASSGTGALALFFKEENVRALRVRPHTLKSTLVHCTDQREEAEVFKMGQAQSIDDTLLDMKLQCESGELRTRES